MIPSAFVQLDRLPLTENGKLDRRALPAPEPQRPELGTPYAAPRTPAERALTAVWQQVLRVKEVGMNDSFFSLGGNSLQLVQLLGFMSTAFTRKVSIAELFQYPTVRSLAAHLEQPAAASRLVAAQERAERQLAAIQRVEPAGVTRTLS
jgi:acyl carrier protein